MPIFISTDDFGASPLANERMLELAKAGKIDRVAVMTDGKISNEEKNILLSTKVKLDLHLDLFPQEKIDRKLKEGVIKRLFVFSGNLLSKKARYLAVKSEWKRQIEKFQQIFGQLPDGLNSHQHIHFFPFYFCVITELAQEYKIPYLRYGKKIIAEKFSLVAWILKMLRIFDNSVFKKYPSVATSDLLISFDWLGKPQEFLKKLENKNIELVCHPERDEEYFYIKDNL